MTDKKYLLFPGIAQTEHGSTLYISARRLAQLYRVPWHECLEYKPFKLPLSAQNLIKLRPDPTGQYKLPVK